MMLWVDLKLNELEGYSRKNQTKLTEFKLQISNQVQLKLIFHIIHLMYYTH